MVPAIESIFSRDGEALVTLLGGRDQETPAAGHRDRTGPAAGVQAAQTTRGLRTMPLARDFRETIRARIECDPAFREELLKEGVECLLSGDVDTGKEGLRDYINATIGFQELGGLTAISAKSLMPMFGPNGNPQPATCSRSSAAFRIARGFTSKCRPFGRNPNRSARGSPKAGMPITGYLTVESRLFECPENLTESTLPH